jgi:dipeptidyl aminopeptidase/acylaminoacyl peptidase
VRYDHGPPSRDSPHDADGFGWPAASGAGTWLAVVEAVCSDRWVVAGELRLIDVTSGRVQSVDTQGVDITHAEWRSDRCLLLAGHRGLETVVGTYDVSSQAFRTVWATHDVTAGFRYISVSGLADHGDCILVGESAVRAPEIAVIAQGRYRAIRSFDVGYGEHARAIDAIERVSWNAPDGREIQGWLLRPKVRKPMPLVMAIHGGPVGLWRNACLARDAVHLLMLIKRGYAVFLPNPRGSSGRGTAFARLVQGDMGGADTHDCLSGIDSLVARGIADAGRLGVTGRSYGGYMTCWLIAQDPRFAAAVPVAPVSNRVSQRLLCTHDHFVDLFLQDRYDNPRGRYFERSPIMHAHKVTTPTLNICGALDRCTPPDQAVQFHNALLERDVPSVLVTYPEEGHGIRRFPAAIDFTTRVVAWFEAFMPVTA